MSAAFLRILRTTLKRSEVVITLACCCLIGLNPLNALAQSESLIHYPPQAQEIPAPGDAMTLIVGLSGSMDTERTLVGYFTKDGKITKVPSYKAYLDINDKPVYELMVNAPVQDMSYRFVVYNPDGSITESEKYSLSRVCVPRVDKYPDLKTIANASERFKLVTAQSKDVETEIKRYERVMGLLDEIDKLLK